MFAGFFAIAALTVRRILGRAEAGLLFLMAAIAGVIGIVGALLPRVLAWPVAVIALWSGIAWVVKGIALRRGRTGGPRAERLEEAIPGDAPPRASAPANGDDASASQVQPPNSNAAPRDHAEIGK
jgi:hypothetical protein